MSSHDYCHSQENSFFKNLKGYNLFPSQDLNFLGINYEFELNIDFVRNLTKNSLDMNRLKKDQGFVRFMKHVNTKIEEFDFTSSYKAYGKG